MSRSERFTNVERRTREVRSVGAVERQRLRKARQMQARARVNAALAVLMDGCSGEFAHDLVEEVLAQSFDLAARHRDGAFACTRGGVHANRVGQQIVTVRPERAKAEALFVGEGGE